MISTFLTFFAALSVAGVAEWFSVVGIMSIYAGAPYNAGLIMGLVVGFAKLVTVSWLYRNWAYADWKLRAPLIYFTLALMLATSIGVFGFLSKAHLEQGASTLDNSAKVERIDQQVLREKSIIADNEKVIAQLDTAINAYIDKNRTDRALSVRRSQAPQRKELRDEIEAAQKRIDVFDEEKLKLTSEVRAIQLEVGPIKYIADIIYGTEGNETTKVESAVKLFTLLIVSTLDPLAVILLIAANHTLLRLQNEKAKKSALAEGKSHGVSGNNETPSDAPDSTNSRTVQATSQPTATQNEIRVDPLPKSVLHSPEMDETHHEKKIGTNRPWPLIPNEKAHALAENREGSALPGTPTVESKMGSATEPTGAFCEDISNKSENDIGFIQDTEIPAQRTAINEEKAYILEDNRISTVQGNKNTVPAVILPPVRSRVGNIRLTVPTVEAEVLLQGKNDPVIQTSDSTVLKELMGQHFKPQKLNEEEKQVQADTIGADTTHNSATAGKTPSGHIQEVDKIWPNYVQEENKYLGAQPIRYDSKKTAGSGKYPVSLSWLKEFKGD